MNTLSLQGFWPSHPQAKYVVCVGPSHGMRLETVAETEARLVFEERARCVALAIELAERAEMLGLTP